MIGEYLSVNEVAQEWNLTVRMVQKMCSTGKIEGVIKFGRSWAIPRDTQKPPDGRIKTGNWVGYRQRKEKMTNEKE